jgi:tetratricopeptide (TPR) repeat protein
MDTWLHSWIVVVLALLAGGARAQESRDAAAIAAYRAGDLAAARQGWTQVLAAEPRSEGDERGRVLFNLGNLAYREGRTLESVGWFSASLRLRPRDADTWANLEHARREAKLEPADRGDLRATLRRLLAASTPAEARLLALVGLLAWAAALAFEALRGGRAGRWLAIGGAGFALLLSGPWLHGVWTHVDQPALVIEDGQALVRSEPRADAAVVAEAQPGAEVEAVDALPGWTKIRVADGTEGWVGAAAVFALSR